jgi:hypothetical protein
MNKREILLIKKKAEDSAIWLLEMRISRQNKLIMELKGTGTNYKDSKFRGLRDKRNIYRKVLLDKLIKWKNGELPDSNPTYQDYLDYLEDKKSNEGITKEVTR